MDQIIQFQAKKNMFLIKEGTFFRLPWQRRLVVPAFACSSVFLPTIEHIKAGTPQKRCTLLQMCSIFPENLLARLISVALLLNWRYMNH